MQFLKIAHVVGLITAFVACSAENRFVGVWTATGADMSFAEGRIPSDQMEEVMRMMISENAPAFELDSDGTARIFGGGAKCDGSWSVEKSILSIQCPSSFLKLEINGDQLVSLPDRTFFFERQ